jgi:hypothetical protein
VHIIVSTKNYVPTNGHAYALCMRLPFGIVDYGTMHI